MMKQTKPHEEEIIKSRLALEAVAKAEGLEATEEEVEKELKDMADAYQMELYEINNMISD